MVDPSTFSEEEKLAFWINLYNSLLLHTFLTEGCPSTHLKRIAMLKTASYNVGGHVISALEIEYSVLRSHSFRSAVAKALKGRHFAADDPRSAWALSRAEPRVSFALSPGTFCAPPLQAFTAEGIWVELEEAKDRYLELAVGMTPDNKVILPKLLEWYAPDFASSEAGLLEWALNQLPPQQRIAIARKMVLKKSPTLAQCVEVASYDWSFRYLILPSSLTEDPLPLHPL